MKKLLLCLLALFMLLSLCACGKTEEPAKKPAVSSSSQEEDETPDKEPLVLTGEGDYCLCRAANKTVSVSSLKELKNYTVGCVNMTDSQTIGNYYCDNVRLGGSDMDIASYVGGGGECDFVIITKTSADAYANRLEIVMYPLVFDD